MVYLVGGGDAGGTVAEPTFTGFSFYFILLYSLWYSGLILKDKFM